MERVCRTIQERLIEAGGDPSGLAAEDVRHIGGCPSCQAFAAAEMGLVRLLGQAVPPSDPALVDGVLASLRPLRIRRRLVAFLPVAASLVLALIGSVMLGGVPGSSLLGRLPLVSSHSWLAAADAIGDWTVALVTATDAARLAVPAPLHLAAVLAALVGVGLVALAARRWHAALSWRRNG